MDQEDARAKRLRREDMVDDAHETFLLALQAFLKGDATFLVETVDDNTRRVSFLMPTNSPAT